MPEDESRGNKNSCTCDVVYVEESEAYEAELFPQGTFLWELVVLTCR